MTERYVMFVRIEQEGEFEKLGWRRGRPCGGLSGTPHEDWSIIMEWFGDGEPRLPEASKPETESSRHEADT